MEPKDVVRGFVDEQPSGTNERALTELLHPDVVDHSRPPGIAPGAEGAREQFHIVRVADGRIVEHWNCVDRLGLRAQLCALPPVPVGAASP